MIGSLRELSLSQTRSVFAHKLVLPTRVVQAIYQFSLSPDPAAWGLNISPDVPEPDDYLHDPDPRQDRLSDCENIFTYRGLTNLGCLILLCIGLLALL